MVRFSERSEAQSLRNITGKTSYPPDAVKFALVENVEPNVCSVTWIFETFRDDQRISFTVQRCFFLC